jgi:hypothetical protein
MSWFERWLNKEHEAGNMACAAGKDPSPEKVASFCWKQAEHGEGCPNLFPRKGMKAKPGTIFGKRKRPRQGVNVHFDED